MRMPQLVGLGMLMLSMAAGTAGADPSFDCSRAQKADEKAICADPQLARLDSLVATAFTSYQPDFQPRAAVARALLAERQGCGADTTCIAAAQLNALDTYGGEAQWADDLVNKLMRQKAQEAAQDGPSAKPPQRIAQCVKTRISEVTTRFGNPLAGSSPDTGIYVAYANGGGVVSYDRDSGFDGVAKGQEVVLCLMSLPQDCPAGDNRGSLYFTLNLTTGSTWIAPDSQHSCGGA